MKYESVLLIGGPKDGVRTAVIEGVSEVRFSALRRESAHIGSRHVPECATVDNLIYRRSPIQSDKGFKGAVYVYANGVDGIAALIEGYRGGREAFEHMADQRGYNTEQYEGAYVSKITQELYDFWSGSPK